MRRAALLALLAAGCGAPGPVTTQVSGSVEGISFRQPVAFYRIEHTGLESDRVLVLISDDASACDNVGARRVDDRSVPVDANGHREPSLFLNLNQELVTGHNQRTLEKGLRADFDPGIGDRECVAFLGEAGIPDEADGGWLVPPCPRPEAAASGEAELFHSDGPRDGGSAEGTFKVAFADGTLTGSFHAQPCPGLVGPPGCTTAPGPTGLALPLALALLRRRRR